MFGFVVDWAFPCMYVFSSKDFFKLPNSSSRTSVGGGKKSRAIECKPQWGGIVYYVSVVVVFYISDSKQSKCVFSGVFLSWNPKNLEIFFSSLIEKRNRYFFILHTVVLSPNLWKLLKFIYSEKAKTFCEIFIFCGLHRIYELYRYYFRKDIVWFCERGKPSPLTMTKKPSKSNLLRFLLTVTLTCFTGRQCSIS